MTAETPMGREEVMSLRSQNSYCLRCESFTCDHQNGRWLTPRELNVLELLTAGYSNKAIAHRLGITVDTAKIYISHVYDKLPAAPNDITPRAAAAEWYRERAQRLDAWKKAAAEVLERKSK